MPADENSSLGNSPLTALPDLFAEASELPLDARESWLRELAREQPAAAAEVRSLLDAAGGGEGWIARPLAARQALVEAADSARPGRVGPFRLEREIGRGGMGRVFLAFEEREAFHRRVALKLLDATQPSADAIRRFRAEVRLLAALEHPGIARFLDGGQSADGTWYLALEFVEGHDLIRYAEERQLDTRARVRLFLQILEAVEYAHERKVVHRDLKPGNILVDTTGRAHLLDFGISKLVADPDASSDAVTVNGGQDRDAGATHTELRLLTPAYASPEQIRGGPVGPASDIYSLGVVFYELLAGVHPYGGKRSSRHEMEQAALSGRPEPPSTAARRTGTGAAVSATPAFPGSRRRISRDLDAICLHALRKDASERYASVAEFARDLERYLAGEPVAARQGGVRYRAGLFVRRHRVALGSAAVLAAAIGATVAIQRAAAGGAATTQAEARPRPLPFPFSASTSPPLEEMQTRFDRAPGDLTAGAALAISLLRADRAREAGLVVGRLRQVPGGKDDPLVDYVDGSLAAKSAEPQRALVLYSRALDAALATGRGELVGQIRAARGRTLSVLGRRAEGGRDMALARADFEAAGDLASLARVLNDLAIDAADNNELARAEELLEQALTATRAASPSNTGATFLGNLAHLAWLQGHPDVAVQRYRETAEIFRGLDRPGREAIQLDGLALSLWQLGRADEARAASARSLALARETGDSGALVGYLHTAAELRLDSGAVEGVAAMADEMERLTSTTGVTFGLAMVDDLRGRLLLLAGDESAGIARLQESLRLLREAGAEEGIANLELTMAEGKLAAGDRAAARTLAAGVAEPLRARGERVELFLADTLLARLDALEGETAEAERRLAANASRAAASPSVELRGAYFRAQAATSRSAGRLDEARERLEEARRLAVASDRGPIEAELRLELAEIELAAGRREAGLAALRAVEAQSTAAGWKGLARRARGRLAAG